jgi:hypothetical protein
MCALARTVEEEVEVAETETLEARVRTLCALFAAEVDADDAVFVGWMRLCRCPSCFSTWTKGID